MLSDGNVSEALMKMPGALVDPNGNILVNGKKTTIWIDGQPSGLSGQDLSNFLNSLPANIVEKVEIVSNPGASFDANTSGGILNIITTSKIGKRISGSFNTFYSGTRTNKHGTSVTLNGKINKLGWMITSGYSQNYSFEDKLLKNNFVSSSPRFVLNQSFYSEKFTEPFFIRTSFDYSFNKKSNLGFKYNLNTSKSFSDTNGYIDSENITPIINSSSISTPNECNSKNELISYYSHKFDDNGKMLTVTSNMTYFDKDVFSPLSQLNTFSVANNELNISNKSLKVDFTLPITKHNMTFNLGSKIANSKVNSFGQYNLGNSNAEILLNPIYNNETKFYYNESNLSFYLEAKKKINRFNVITGLRYEEFKIKSNVNNNESSYNRTYKNLFPSASFLYEVNKITDFTFSYARKIEQPGYTELDPNLNGSFDNFTSSIGNPNLSANFYNNFETKLSLLKYAYIGFNYQFSKTENLLVIESLENLKTTQTIKSFNNLRNYNLSIAIPIPFAIFSQGLNFFNQGKINIDKLSFLYFVGGYNSYRIDNAEEYIDSFKPYYYFNAYSQIILPYEFKMSINYSFASKGTHQIYQIEKPIHRLDLTIARSFFNKSFKINFSVRDVFNTYGINAFTKNKNINTNYSQYTDTQNFRLGLSYTFGKFSAIHKQKEIKDELIDTRIDKKSDISPVKTE